MKLSPIMERALEKLTDEWQCAYELQESMSTLDALAERKLAQRKHELGYMFFPRMHILYKKP